MSVSQPEAPEVWAAALEAARLVESGMVVGLGTGRAASMFVRALARRVGEGLRIKAVPTSNKTEELARELSLPLVSLGDIDGIDIDVDGADEVSPRLDLIKGHGGALLRERVVAAFSSRFVVIVGEEKLVDRLGERVGVPVEVAPFAVPVAKRWLTDMGAEVQLRREGQAVYRTDNQNAILDAGFDNIDDPAELERLIDAVPGVVDNGLFVGMTDLVLIQTSSGVRRLERDRASDPSRSGGPTVR